MKKYADVDEYVSVATRWPEEIVALREILLSCELTEAVKWGKPCYSDPATDNNIAIMQSMKGFLALLFTKGALLDDPRGLLQEQGENTRSARRLCFTSAAQVRKSAPAIRALVRNAVKVEAEGTTLPPRPPLVLVEELQSRLDSDPKLAAAFESLTPGRQREYNLHVSGAKQSKTRAARVEKFIPRILARKGFRDR